jgi:lysophospholipase L1-like esterase
LSQLSKAAARVIVLAVPPIDASPRLTVDAQDKAMRLIDRYNSALPELSVRSGATFAALPPMPTPHTIDGVHLSVAGYDLWNQAVLQGAYVLCGTK